MGYRGPHRSAPTSLVCTKDLTVAVSWSKTIQYGQRQLCIPISRVPSSVLCPVKAYKLLVNIVPAPHDYPAFCYFSKDKCIPLTYSVFVSQLRTWLTAIGVNNVNKYSTHSFRRGGATFAFQCGVNATLIKTQGDSTSHCYLQYKLGLNDKLVTTQTMAKCIINKFAT